MAITCVTKRAVFLDRDGVINQSRREYVKRWEEFIFLPGALSAMRTLAATPFLVVIVTNQSAVGRGLMTRELVDDIHRRMVDTIVDNGGRIDGIYYCPHSPEIHCSCRKPLPGLFRRAAVEHGIDLGRSYCIGDKISDLEAGARVGCKGILVLSGEGRVASYDDSRRYQVAEDLSEAVNLIAASEGIVLA